MTPLRERSKLSRPRVAPTLARSLFPIAGIIVFAVLLQAALKPWLETVSGGDFYAKVLLDIGINVTLAVSLTIVNGFTGQFSIGHAAFMAVGGYTAAGIVYYGSMFAFGSAEVVGGSLSTMGDNHAGPLFRSGDLIFCISLIVGGIVAAICGFLVGLPSLRLKGDYLAIVTLGFGEIVRVLIQQSRDVSYDLDEIKQAPLVGLAQLFTQKHDDWQAPVWARLGGPLGFSGLPFYTSLFWAFLVAGITLLVAIRLKRSTFGRAFLSIREDEVASEAMGVNTTSYKVWAFVISAFFAGVAGALFAHETGIQLSAQELGFQKSFDIIIMVVLGGMGSISGAAIAAAAITILPELLRDPTKLVGWQPQIIALTILAAIVAGAVRLGGRRATPLWATALAGLSLIAITWLGYGAVKVAAATGHPLDIRLGNYRMIIFALSLILMMILRPQGLLGVREIWDKSFWNKRRPAPAAASPPPQTPAPEGTVSINKKFEPDIDPGHTGIPPSTDSD
jgi:branched-chain amino acid transport system permease protein